MSSRKGLVVNADDVFEKLVSLEKEELKKVIVESLEKFGLVTDLKFELRESVGLDEEETLYGLYSKVSKDILARISESEQVITEDRIMEVVTKEINRVIYHERYTEDINCKILSRRIASEILQGQGWESIGVVKITEENIDNVVYWFKEWIDKDIEIAVRVIKNKQ